MPIITPVYCCHKGEQALCQGGSLLLIGGLGIAAGRRLFEVEVVVNMVNPESSSTSLEAEGNSYRSDDGEDDG